MSEDHIPLPKPAPPYSFWRGVWKSVKAVGIPALTTLAAALLLDPELTTAIKTGAGTGVVGAAVGALIVFGMNWAKNRSK